MSDIYYKHAHRSQEEIDAIKHRYEDFDATLIPQIFKEALDLTAISWKRPDSYGTIHVIYTVVVKRQSEPLLLRANIGGFQPEIEMKTEQLISDKARAFGVLTNKIIYVDISRKKLPFDFQIQEVLPGQDMEDHFDGTKEQYDKISFILGTYVAKFEELTLEKFGRFDEGEVLRDALTGTKSTFFDYIITRLDDDLKFLVDRQLITSGISDRIRALFDEYKPVMKISRGSLVHHDLADHNFMCLNGKLTAIFDWENAVSGDPVLDLASCPTWVTHYPREEKLIEGYKSVRSLPDHFVDKMHIYRLRTMIWKMVFAVRAGILNDVRRQRFVNALAPFKIQL
ncbi:aminoglycoside phosphotransferase family protein [Candidatus Gottesmanbacteria bacterium]|nr:aminoglycoside phosphotransferase family protein [Candidatus Gottesmanbacteria bacterium]